MSFTNSLPRIYSGESIEKNAPPASGVYGISNANKWLFIGETDNIRTSMLAHWNEREATQFDSPPTGFSFELCAPQERLVRQQYLIVELAPACQHRSTPRRSRYR